MVEQKNAPLQNLGERLSQKPITSCVKWGKYYEDRQQVSVYFSNSIIIKAIQLYVSPRKMSVFTPPGMT